ncbi:vesicle-associated protein 1-1-like [Panicum miliaceum]|uniref:Vesicle-associated protein 1-1-like n=1 Tax=Panicum miliaceum TaxID=4540 RepID=A0A3L6SU71_PANMI|nr:vesicle-associated protein 1-1-like [Panicum miliaceum]
MHSSSFLKSDPLFPAWFSVEVKKQSTCTVHLVNKSNEYVAFKVKTTSPKRYCVRPNTGVILPRKICEFTVTMQALRTAPPDMQLKDKFLVQTTVVPYGTSDEDLVPAFFSKETGRYIEESKLRVVLVSASHSLEEEPINGVHDTEPAVEVPVLKEMPNIENEVPAVAKEVPPPLEQTPAIATEISSPVKETPGLREIPVPINEAPVTEDVQNLKSKLNNLESKLEEAERMIIRLREESRSTTQERDKLQQEMVFLRKKGAPRSQVGFPLLFVVYVALLAGMLAVARELKGSRTPKSWRGAFVSIISADGFGYNSGGKLNYQLPFVDQVFFDPTHIGVARQCLQNPRVPNSGIVSRYQYDNRT